MPQLNETPSARKRIHDVFNAYWSRMGTDAIELEILDRLGQLDSQRVLNALDAHLDDTTPSSSVGGRPTGAYPPTVADLQRHIQAANKQAWQARKAAKEAKLKRELSQESDRAAVQVFDRLNWRSLIGQHQAKRDAIIAHLKRTEKLDFTRRADLEAFRPVQAALYKTNSELAPEKAAEIFRDAKEPINQIEERAA